MPESRNASYPTFPPPLRVSYSIQIPKTIRLKISGAFKLPAPQRPCGIRAYKTLAGVFSISGLRLVQLVLSLRVVRIAQTAFSDWHSLRTRA